MNYYRKDVLLNLLCSFKKCVKIFYENVENRVLKSVLLFARRAFSPLEQHDELSIEEL